jgi:hypothetical protein
MSDFNQHLLGYTCGLCGQFVPGGTQHDCTGTPWPVNEFRASYVLTDNALLERIAKALETIADHLSKMH